MTETRYKNWVRSGYLEERVVEILSALDMVRVRKKCAVSAFLEDENLASKIRTSLSERDSIAFLLPAFPFKSQNIEKKCLGELPDKAEEIAMANISSLGAKLNATARTKIILALDGFTYADLVGIPSQSVIRYASAIDAMRPIRESIELFDTHKTSTEGEEVSKMLDQTYTPSLHEIRNRIERDPIFKDYYVGLKRFWEYDLSHGENTLGSKARWRKAAEIAIRMLARNIAYSKYLEEKFPHAIRLSIHASHGKSGRFHINLLPDTTDTAGGSPWHGVALQTADKKWRVVKREYAEQRGCLLVYENGRPSYYAEPGEAPIQADMREDINGV